MDAIYNLSQLFAKSGCHFEVFDLSRRVQKLDKKTFLEVEKAALPYPFPMQRHASLAIVYWQQDDSQTHRTASIQPWIWFLKFPLDERGLFNQSDIGNFLRYVTAALGVQLGANISEEEEQQLADNPYTFKPTEDKLASFHSQVSVMLKQMPSSYYHAAQQYFAKATPAQNWQSLGLQGITDVCTRLAQDNNKAHIYKSLTWLSQDASLQPALYALLGALEHCELPETIAQKLSQLANSEIEQDTCDIFLLAAYVRALASHQECLTQVVRKVLSSELLAHREVLIAIAGRSWDCLEDQNLANLFLTRLAQSGEQDLFNQVFADLVMIPKLRMVFLPLLNSPATPELEAALVSLMQQTKAKQQTN